jgi:hypothetical protein
MLGGNEADRENACMDPKSVDFDDRLASFSSSRYEQLREPQARALAGYMQCADAGDIAIELPTGYGKTLIALLIADLALEQGRTVAYLTGTNQLTDQVLLQARDLPGLEAVRFSGGNYPPASLAAYHDAMAIGVMNYWTYFNTSPKVEAADLVVLDDAHLAEQPLTAMFALRIERGAHPDLYLRVCDLVLAHTAMYPSIELMREDAALPTTPPELLAFPHWVAIADSVADLISDHLPDDARFIWPRVRPNLRACGVLIGPSAIEIRPYHPPTQTLPGYRQAKQRLYLSATLGTMDDLQRRLGVAEVVEALEDPVAEGQVGRRVLLLNPGDDAPLADAPLRFALAQASLAGRAAWLCASNAEADLVQQVLAGEEITTYRLRGGGDDGALDEWLSDVRGHLVTAGRFDGLDLAGDLCRLVVLPSVPAASTEFERFVMAYLADATFMRHRVGQRVTQALGRANRRAGDWAMYLGLSPGFGTLLAQSAVRQAIPADVRLVVDDGLTRLEGGWMQAHQEARDFWDAGGRSEPPPERDETTRARPGRSRPAATAGSAVHEVTAVTRLWLGDPAGAAEAAGAAARALGGAGEVEHAAFWHYVEGQAHYEEGLTGSLGKAIDAVRTATQSGAATAWFVRLGRVLSELRGEQASVVDEQPWTTWDEWISESGIAGVRRSVARCRNWLVGTHDQQAEALVILGRMAGISASRPTGQSVTDVVWNWASSRRVERRLWEVKTGTPNAIPRDWVDQALGQVAEARGGDRLSVVGCIMTELEAVEPEAKRAGANSLCFIRREGVLALADLLGDRLLDYAARTGGGTAAERGAAREMVEPSMPTSGWVSDLLAPSNGKLVTSTDVRARF